MAAPVITSITPPGPITAVVGTPVTVRVVSQDADARTEQYDITPVDSVTGDRGTTQHLQLVFTDPVTLEVKGPQGSPTVVNVQPDGTITFIG